VLLIFFLGFFAPPSALAAHSLLPANSINVDSLFIPWFAYQKRLQTTRLDFAGNQRTCSDFSWGTCSDSPFSPRNGSKGFES
jgi:hypothetical protein